jgi:chromosomal replication initiator protein
MPGPKLTVEDIQVKVCCFYNIKPEEMRSACRAAPIARPRQMAMYLARRMTRRSLPELGRRFGGRDHTTVMHSISRVEALAKADPDLARDLKLLTGILMEHA